MKYSSLWIFAILLLVMLTGCASNGSKYQAESQGKVFRASGFARLEEGFNVPANQRWLMAEQAAKRDANRDLAAQLYQEVLDDQNTVGSQVMKDEAYRIYVDTYLRDARSVDKQTLKDVLKATMELKVSPRFYTCMSGDTAQINRCLKEDKKLGLTRLGFKPARITTVNLNCANTDCGDQYQVQGFSKTTNSVDDTLLNAGLPDSQWIVHTGASLFARAYFLQVLINGY
ncbi:hypothetical protein [Methylomonas sp. AM2-LC]|uniref:hypothetical protein n=1 Tax=Methylomonas sp. AM2-LC TaxID=3153301 RepID=UPI0032650C38